MMASRIRPRVGRRKVRVATLCASSLVCAFVAAAHAQIRTDGTLGGPAGALAGPNFQINEALGRLAGSNLFHSFQVFNVGNGESATFLTTTGGLTNVISRVTGGSASQINGPIALHSTNAAPNFFFINPAGVVFGNGASIDVPAGFHVSTANYVSFPDGIYSADLSRTSSFSSAPPAAFGFLGTTRATISVREGASIVTAQSQPLSVVGGDLAVDRSVIETHGGDLRVAAIGQLAGLLGFAGPLPATTGTLTIANGGQILVDTPASGSGGKLSVSAGNIVINRNDGVQTGIYSVVNPGVAGNAADIDVAAAATLRILNGGAITSLTAGFGDAGKVTVAARNILIDGQQSVRGTGIASQAVGGIGNAGVVSVSVTDDLVLKSGGKISTTTDSSGRAGAVSVNAGHVLIDGRQSDGTISTKTTGIVSEATSRSRGDAGSVDVAVTGDLFVVFDGVVSTSTFSSGNAGPLTASAANITVGAGGKIASDAQGGTGNAGNVRVSTAGLLEIRSGGEISSSIDASGNGGSVSIRAGEITIKGTGGGATGIFSQADGGSNGNAGNIDIYSVGNIDVTNSGLISSSTLGQGNAGNVTVVTPGALTVTNAALISSSSVYTLPGSAAIGSAPTPAAPLVGNAGNVDVHAGMLLVDGYGTGIIAAASFGSSGQTGNLNVTATDSVTLRNAGFLSIQNAATVLNPRSIVPTALNVSAPNISLRGGSISASSDRNVSASIVNVNFRDLLSLDGGSITTAANAGNGGPITIIGGTRIVLDNSQVTTSVRGLAGDGGTISIGADSLILNTGFIQANTAAKDASGGNVAINVRNLVSSGSTAHVAGQAPYSFQPGVLGFNVIQAAAPTGVSGTIEISTPVLDITGSLTALPARLLDSGGLGRSPCAIVGGSSFSQVGRGGLPRAAATFMWVGRLFDVAGISTADSPSAGSVFALEGAMGTRVDARGAPCWS